MKITFTKHAQNQIKVRNLNKKFIIESVKNSLKTEQSSLNRKVAQKIYNIRGKKFLLRVFYKERREGEIEIITAYLTTKIDKYLKG